MLRKLGITAAVAAAALLIAQVVLAAPPQPTFTIMPDDSPAVGESVRFEASANDPDAGDTHTFAWDFGDGATGSGPTASHSYNTPGVKTVTLTVTDAAGESATVTDTLVVDAPPTASFNFTPTNPNPNQQVTFTSTSSDAEGPVTLAWDLDNDGQFDDGSDATEVWSFPTGGDKTVRLRATDSNGTARETSRTVSVFSNQPPNASFDYSGTNPVTPAVPDVGETINFTSTSTDPDGNGTIARVDWDLDGDGQFDDGSANPIQHSFSTPGNKTVGLRVTDSSGATHETTRTIRVNALPVARATILNPQAEAGQKYNVPLINQPILFKGGAAPALPGAAPAPGCPPTGGSPASPGSSDAEGAIARYQWDLNGDGTFETDRGADPDAPYPGFGAAGPRTAFLRVTDSDGATADARLDFRVNTPPNPGYVFQPDTPVIDEEVTFSATPSDPDAADAGRHTFYWDLDDDGTFCETGETGQSVKRTFPTANTAPGHRTRLRVTDDGGITREVARNVIVQPTIPRGSFSFSPQAPLPGQAVTFTGSASSPTGKAIASIEWDFSYDPSSGQFDVEASGASVSHPFSSAGPKTVAMRVQEAGGGFAVIRDTVVVNAPPQAGFSVAPETGFINETITLSSTSSDPDGPLTRQEWDLDNDGQFDDANAAVVSARFANPGTYPLKLRVTDSRGATATANGQVTVQRRPVPPPQMLPGVVITLRGNLSGKATRVKRLFVKAPKGSTIRVRCIGKRCPKRLRAQKGKGTKRVRFKKVERRFRTGTKLVVTVTRSGFIGKQTTFTMRRGKQPRRRDLCLNPGAKKANSCPTA